MRSLHLHDDATGSRPRGGTDEYVARALEAGAAGFLGKDVTPEILLAGIRTVVGGDALLSPSATRSLINRFLSGPGSVDDLSLKSLAVLTDREREITALAAHGLSNQDIAQRLVVSPLTVRTHIHRAMTKVGARDRAQLVVIAYQQGLVRVR
ncbi:response regulator transcription factor [Actinoplanes friuliensis]|uniref:Putative response regulator n=1 Tax=Actinoplanes friuliensis DSM 7358 TaxID=1246995 RepID=U5W7U0_9ACTN|nr:response regulator transcription factor [Actinoplanes friuliensis]AGZ44021.1 putative response regulator [Actinoplanes friuliensis DSM 7358]